MSRHPFKIVEPVATEHGRPVLEVGPDGIPSWSQPYGGPLSDGAVAVTTSPDADVLAVGDFEAELEFIEGDKLVAAGATDLFIAKFDR